jgi:D-alanine-D-alanine ligase
MNKKRNVLVVFGGSSSEHEVSRVSAKSVIDNIDKNKFNVSMIGITKEGKWLPYNGSVEMLPTGEWQEIAQTTILSQPAINDSIISVSDLQVLKPDVVIPVLHGLYGEDGTVQGLFELAGIPYVGCGVLSSAVGMDKAYTKIIFEKAGIPQGDYLVFSKKEIRNDIEKVVVSVEEKLEYPCFVKPSNAGSSMGVSKAKDRETLVIGLLEAIKHDRKVLVEEFIDGRELECGVLGNDSPIASVVGEVKPCNEFYDYEAKYHSGDSSEVIIPADIDVNTARAIREYAIKAFKSLDCSGLSRVDFFMDKKTGNIYINEINTMPGFTKISMYPKLWDASGVPYNELIERLIDLAIERHEEKE